MSENTHIHAAYKLPADGWKGQHCEYLVRKVSLSFKLVFYHSLFLRFEFLLLSMEKLCQKAALVAAW